MITFDEFKNGEPNDLNEGLFDKLAGMFSKITTLFKDPAKLDKGIESTMDQLGEGKTKKFIPKQAKASESFIVQMGDAKKPETKYSMSLTKLADLPDGSGLFQITGTTSKEMLKSLEEELLLLEAEEIKDDALILELQNKIIAQQLIIKSSKKDLVILNNRWTTACWLFKQYKQTIRQF
jgi:hypothetical protein